MALSGRGRLLAATTVHLHADTSRPAPFTIGKIALEDGPVVRTLLADAVSNPAVGSEMLATLVAVGTGADGAALLDLRFAPAR
jgi:uncharacterized OB-fold protein